MFGFSVIDSAILSIIPFSSTATWLTLYYLEFSVHSAWLRFIKKHLPFKPQTWYSESRSRLRDTGALKGIFVHFGFFFLS